MELKGRVHVGNNKPTPI